MSQKYLRIRSFVHTVHPETIQRRCSGNRIPKLGYELYSVRPMHEVAVRHYGVTANRPQERITLFDDTEIASSKKMSGARTQRPYGCIAQEEYAAKNMRQRSPSRLLYMAECKEPSVLEIIVVGSHRCNPLIL